MSRKRRDRQQSAKATPTPATPTPATWAEKLERICNQRIGVMSFTQVVFAAVGLVVAVVGTAYTINGASSTQANKTGPATSANNNTPPGWKRYHIEGGVSVALPPTWAEYDTDVEQAFLPLKADNSIVKQAIDARADTLKDHVFSAYDKAHRQVNDDEPSSLSVYAIPLPPQTVSDLRGLSASQIGVSFFGEPPKIQGFNPSKFTHQELLEKQVTLPAGQAVKQITTESWVCSLGNQHKVINTTFSITDGKKLWIFSIGIDETHASDVPNLPITIAKTFRWD